MWGWRKKEIRMATVNAVNVVTLCSKTQKKKFATKQEAEGWEERNRAQYGIAKQNAYACEHCDSYHLSSLLPGANGHSAITTNYAAIENRKVPSDRKQHRVMSEEDVKQMHELRRQGLTMAEIASRVGCSTPTVIKYLNNNQHQPTAASLDAIALKKKELEGQLRKLEEEEQRIIEAKRLKVAKLLDGSIQIRKETAFIVLSPGDCTELHGKLEEILTDTAVTS